MQTLRLMANSAVIMITILFIYFDCFIDEPIYRIHTMSFGCKITKKTAFGHTHITDCFTIIPEYEKGNP